MVKLPRNPPDPLFIADDDVLDWPHHSMVRVHGTVGPYALPWHHMRHFGPTGARFDPHPPSESGEPPGSHPDFAVLLAAADVDTALAEVFQHGRIIQPAAPNKPLPHGVATGAAASVA
ncbi:RES domain-containing protein [Nakamurella sp. GG22]